MTALPFATAAVRHPMELNVAPTAIARSARVADAWHIHRLVALWSGAGLTIPRSLGEILGSIGDFVVASRPGHDDVVACGALEMVTPTIAEIRSISVDTTAPRIGAGRVVVKCLMNEAAERGVERVVLLTKTPDFFARCGFEALDHALLPQAYTGPHLGSRNRTLAGRTAMSASPLHA